MTLQDWIDESKERYQTMPPHYATAHSIKQLYHGFIRRTADPMMGKTIWERDDWDVLVVLDACRVDLMDEVLWEYGPLPTEVPSVYSNASASIDWIERNFNECPEEAQRAGYVTANPFARHNDPDTRSADLSDDDVGHLECLYETDWQDIGNGIETVPPRPVTDRAIDVWRRRNEIGIDKLIVHYMQPHEPFRSRPEWGNGNHKLLKNLVSEGSTAGSSVYPLLQDGTISLDEFWEVYIDNLRWVLDDVLSRLFRNCDANLVLTADHGNGLGEWGGLAWHHPGGRIYPEVRKVPWIELEGLDEHTVSPSGPKEASPNDVESQLEALGYK